MATHEKNAVMQSSYMKVALQKTSTQFGLLTSKQLTLLLELLAKL